ncbi:hypothetical protein Patl1_01277 [Pistacia atlantica]|uniref:Uncharacterized protein n=1 Tax=Pistacia atlantica TaxID=434234 RepID=A0ACC1CAM9_9ROSI|nr:hypothetical protein Patl1_01277 [Pistacia atlantica]
MILHLRVLTVMQVHPCGQYRKNTIVGILQAEYGLAPLFPVHRLDRLVSGLLILARNASKADLFRQQIEAGKVQKQYVAKIIGVFPEGEQVVDVNINYDARAGRSTAEVRLFVLPFIVSTRSMHVMALVPEGNWAYALPEVNNLRSKRSHQAFGLCRGKFRSIFCCVQVGDSCGDTPLKGKAACTKFTRISTNGTHSIVLCKPITGRTHQIRVHLQYTGHPIANDMLYLSEPVSDCATQGMSADRSAACSGHSLTSITRENFLDKDETSSEEFRIDPMCTNCPNLAPKGYDVHEEGLWLHCVRYSGPGWGYECPYPDWASNA